MRAKVYGGCAACILAPPTCPICYGTAAAILETNIAKYKRETEAFVREFNSWADTFGLLQKMAGSAAKVSKDGKIPKRFGKLTGFAKTFFGDVAIPLEYMFAAPYLAAGDIE